MYAVADSAPVQRETCTLLQIQHQYCLTDEKGPAHKKAFTVTLRLGPTEQYNAAGPSIKKAQHSAAEVALQDTAYKHPPPKPARVARQSKSLEQISFTKLAAGHRLLYKWTVHWRFV